MITSVLLSTAMASNLIANPAFTNPDPTGKAPANYTLTGNARWAWCGQADEITTLGIALHAYSPIGQAQGEVSQLVTNIDPKNGKWLRFTFRGRAQDGFTIVHDHLAMKIAFYAKNGANYLDDGERLIYREIRRDRQDFAANGDDHKNGADVWRTYAFEELLPFKEVNSVKVSVDFKDGNAKDDKNSAFYVQDFSLTQSQTSSDGRTEPTAKAPSATPENTNGMVALGGRWFYLPVPGENIANKTVEVTEANAKRLFYNDGRVENPFATNMTAWLRKGNLDANGKLVTEDRLIRDNVVIDFKNDGWVYFHVHNIPNHPTAKFPDTYGTQGYNRSYIQEHLDTYAIPLTPELNPNAVAMTANDANRALNMGPVGIAVNGVPFFNPFDANMQDAANVMDKCCGHPSPDNRYHYHKYPVCVNTPFVDKGETHSPIIGFAQDGFPIYGPYESQAVMAKDLRENKLTPFNAHYDPTRGWHYHATPGQFPYLIGGYIGVVK